MSNNELKRQIYEANKAYRAGNPVMTDSEYDSLLEKLRLEMVISGRTMEYEIFRNQLNEGEIEEESNLHAKVKHPFVMGSLDKNTATNTTGIAKIVGASQETFVSAKIDGISCRVEYDQLGNFIGAYTRGDGFEGRDVTDLVKECKGVVRQVSSVLAGKSVRGELVLKFSDFEQIKNRFANPRNATAGIFNRKLENTDMEVLRLITFISYEVMGPGMAIAEQFQTLKSEGFSVADSIQVKFSNVTDAVARLTQFAQPSNFDYPTDGAVVSGTAYQYEDRYRPVMKQAFKLNQVAVTTRIVGFDWGEPSFTGKLTPVAIVEPVEISGTTVTHANCHNLNYIEDNRLAVGAEVVIKKMGEIIPQIVECHNTQAVRLETVIPAVCPVCGAPTEIRVSLSGVKTLFCSNPNCVSKTIQEVTEFVTRLGIEHAKTSQLKKFGITRIDDLFTWKADRSYKSQADLEDQIAEKFLNRDLGDIFTSMVIPGAGEKELTKVLEKYGDSLWLDPVRVAMDLQNSTYVVENLVGKALPDVVEVLKKVSSDPRRATTPSAKVASSTTTNTTNTTITGVMTMKKGTGMSICFTGKSSLPRKEMQLIAKERYGLEIHDSVKSNTTFLVCADPTSGSSKMRKAIEQGTDLISEDDFLSGSFLD